MVILYRLFFLTWLGALCAPRTWLGHSVPLDNNKTKINKQKKIEHNAEKTLSFEIIFADLAAAYPMEGTLFEKP